MLGQFDLDRLTNHDSVSEVVVKDNEVYIYEDISGLAYNGEELSIRNLYIIPIDSKSVLTFTDKELEGNILSDIRITLGMMGNLSTGTVEMTQPIDSNLDTDTTLDLKMILCYTYIKGSGSDYQLVLKSNAIVVNRLINEQGVLADGSVKQVIHGPYLDYYSDINFSNIKTAISVFVDGKTKVKSYVLQLKTSDKVIKVPRVMFDLDEDF